MGRYLLTIYPDAATPSGDIGDLKVVQAILDAEKPDVVINAAGKTGRPNVDWCEDHKDETLKSNVIGPLILMEECASRNIYFVHLSSGCIYEGDNGGKGFDEEDPPNFFGSFYSRSKGWVDQILKDFPILQLRMRMPFDASDEPRNLIQKLIKYSKVLDAENSITYIPDFLDTIKVLIDKRVTGTFNVVNPGTASPYRIMQEYKKIVNPDQTFEKLSLDHIGDVTKAGRSNCLLNTKKLDQYIVLPDVNKRVTEALEILKAKRLTDGKKSELVDSAVEKSRPLTKI